MTMYYFLAFALLSSGIVQAASPCDLRSASVGSFDQAVDRVKQLPELGTWKASHPYPVAYGMGPNTQTLIAGKCYWDIPVFADHPERFERWEDFYVSANSKTMFVYDAIDDKPITITHWRKKRSTIQSGALP